MDDVKNLHLDDDQAWLILLMFFLSSQREWEKLRTYAGEQDDPPQELLDFFNRVFNAKLPIQLFSPGTLFYRARRIASNNESNLGVNLDEIANEVYRVIMSDMDFKAIQQMEADGSLYLNAEDYFHLKQISMKEYTPEQLSHFDSLRKKYSVPGVYGFDADGSGVPPEKFRKEGRLNTVSDAYLYLALEKKTAIHEMRPSIGQQYSLASYQSMTELKIVNLTGEYSNLEESTLGFTGISKISEPNVENDTRFYRITQHMAHLLQERGFDGIKYRSAMRSGGYNILLFDEKNVQFLSSEIVSINDVKIDYSQVLPFTN